MCCCPLLSKMPESCLLLSFTPTECHRELVIACLRVHALGRCPGAKTKAFPVPMLSVEAEQELQCNPESWGMSWTDQVRLSSKYRSCILFCDPVYFVAICSKVQQRRSCLPPSGTWYISRLFHIAHSLAALPSTVQAHPETARAPGFEGCSVLLCRMGWRLRSLKSCLGASSAW